MSYSFFTILVSIFLLTDPGVNETKSTTNTEKPAVKKTGAVNKPASKKRLFKNSKFLTVHL